MYMKNIILFAGLAIVVPGMVSAAIPYRTELIRNDTEVSGLNNNTAFASEHRFYVGGMYDYSMWIDSGDGAILQGKNTSGFDVVAGVRALDTLRIEADYAHISAKWDAFSLTSETAFINAIVDARIGSLYRLFYRQHLVPYVGIGAGLAWHDAQDVEISHDMTVAFAGLAGIAFEIGEHFALDFGYRYVYMMSPKFDTSNMNPRGHQLRVGARINF